MKRFLRRFASIFSLFVMVLGLAVSVYLVQNRTNFFPRAFGEPANLVVNLNAILPATGSWKNYAQGGEETDNMLENIVPEVAALSPSYIRVDHIYDYYNVVSRSSDGSLVFNWTELDEVVRTIQQTGATPLLSLSYMPSAISTGTQTDLPRNFGEWQRVVRETIERYSGINALNIPAVYYEVWNEPDLFGDFKLYGDKNYLELYRYSSLGATQAQNVNEFKLGGPATTALYPNWFSDFLTFVSENNLRLDFYSWHRYSKEVAVYDEDVDNIRTWLADFPEFLGIELLITEMGYSPENDPAYDGKLAAIQSMATITQLEGRVDKAFSFELIDGPNEQKYWGRWGALTHERHGVPEKKPRYRAFEFLNQMPTDHRVLVAGQGFWVKALAMSDGENTKLMVVNYDTEGKHFETVPITFENLPDSSFTFRRTDFLGGVTEREVRIENSDSWQTFELLNPNSAAIFEIIN